MPKPAPSLKLILEIIIRDKNGVILSHEITPSRSWVRAFMGFICFDSGSAQADTPIKNTDGVEKALATDAGGLRRHYLNGPAGVNAYGIVFGLDDTPVDRTDYALASIIAEGVGANQLHYLGCSVSKIQESGNDSWCQVQRGATNNGAANVIVKEVGIYARTYLGSALN